ncbi:CpsD/CapB family tyrosine-protein kinase [Polymorphobacter fuscus]|uniref:Protein tyrosine kinase n=1 Tax=Sandarakinorhabdus fusca TaxID=1439888 RepID=A0A7C9GN80_9SPHN|nr:CpsD/CapB family tyrosine-protein kinase [Polymorphobacter fuscus]KAB7648925.1 protein tyrosine kinase [Polymorphobacter fuscus]MQT16515.1 protein tyrosine kinase [Polymorphobacter fuscus]NJC07195.1 capsular exopolysaccharide synthesis family protein [Polymorphobacter fuscus]
MAARTMTDTSNVIDQSGQVAVTGAAGQGFDSPIRDVLLRLGYLTEDQTQRVVAYQAEKSLDFDQAARELGFISDDDLDRARDLLINSLALQSTNRRPVSDELVVINEPVSPRAEAIRMLRTQIIAQHIKVGRRGIVVASPVEGVGCTFMAANLAAGLSQVGVKTLIVDCNLRSPRVDQVFGLDPNAPGLSSYLSLQVARPERVVHANVLPNLSVITAGPPVLMPQELLSSNRFRDGVNTLLREFDMVLFDTAPANSSADALTVGGVVGYAMVVARRDHSYFKDVTTLVNQLQSTRCTVIGSVLNEF